jgi:hypothetical protein
MTFDNRKEIIMNELLDNISDLQKEILNLKSENTKLQKQIVRLEEENLRLKRKCGEIGLPPIGTISG